jgi:diacylglycerol kinase (ATP)
MRYRIIVNPHARGGRGRVLAERCLAELARLGCGCETSFIERFEDAGTLSREANLRGCDAIVAVGGDGTINKVLNGFYDEEGKRISDALFGVVHVGTSPDFCKSYHVPLGVAEAVEVLARRRTRKIPIGMIRFQDANEGEHRQGEHLARPATTYFACCANVGLGAALARKANGGIRRRLGDTLGTFASLLAILRSYEPDDYDLVIDGNATRHTRVYNMSVGLTPYIASGIKLPRRDDRREQRLSLMVVRNLSARTLPAMLCKVYRGRPFADTDYLSVAACSRIRFAAARRQSDVEQDGDPCGRLPCTIEMAPDALELIF